MKGSEQVGEPSASSAESIAEEDAALVVGVLRKDRKATAEFVARYADSIYAYVCSRLAPRLDLVDDLVQDIFLAAWENLDRYRGTGPLQGWIIGIARHKVEDYYRARLHEAEPIGTGELDVAPALMPEVDGWLEREQVHKRIWEVLAGIPEAYRLVLLWRYWEKCSTRDMALKTGKSEKAIERLLARAREQFRQRWSDE